MIQNFDIILFWFIVITVIIHLIKFIATSWLLSDVTEKDEHEEYVQKIRKILVKNNFRNIPRTIWELKRKELAEVRNFYFELLDKIEYLEKIDLALKEKNKYLILEELKGQDLSFIKEYYFNKLINKEFSIEMKKEI